MDAEPGTGHTNRKVPEVIPEVIDLESMEIKDKIEEKSGDYLPMYIHIGGGFKHDRNGNLRYVDGECDTWQVNPDLLTVWEFYEKELQIIGDDTVREVFNVMKGHGEVHIYVDHIPNFAEIVPLSPVLMLPAPGDPLEPVDGVCNDVGGGVYSDVGGGVCSDAGGLCSDVGGSRIHEAGGLCSDAGVSRINEDEAFNEVGERRDNNSDEHDGIFNEADNVEELEANEYEHGLEDFPNLSDSKDEEAILTRDNLRHYNLTQHHADNINIVVQGEDDAEIQFDDECARMRNVTGRFYWRWTLLQILRWCGMTPVQRKKTKDKLKKKFESVSNAEYNRLFDYTNELRSKDPEASVVLQCCRQSADTTSTFLRMYVCFSVLKKGFLAGCRCVIGVDGAFLKGVYKGELLTVVGRDANNQMYPIAWAVVEGLTKAVEELFPYVEHRFCARHKYSNFRKQHKGKELQKAFWKCVKARTIPEFSKALDELTSLKPSARELYLRAFCGQRIVARREFGDRKFIDDFGPRTWEKLVANTRGSRRCKSLWPGSNCYEVQGNGADVYMVNVDERKCTCREWDLIGIPCRHAM
ncbi:hypothetical protein SLEP1_g56932, partial [Rubroshorea leprosula]